MFKSEMQVQNAPRFPDPRNTKQEEVNRQMIDILKQLWGRDNSVSNSIKNIEYNLTNNVYYPETNAELNHNLFQNMVAPNDDHTQYLLIDGSRAMTGNLDMDGHTIILDADGDSWIGEVLDDQIGFFANTGIQFAGLYNDIASQMLMANGIMANPSYSFLDHRDDGFYWYLDDLYGDAIGVVNTGVRDFSFSTSAFNLENGSVIRMSDDSWIGLGVAGGRIIFDSTPAPDLITVSDATLALDTVVNAGVDTDKFLVLGAANNVDFRTGAEVLADIGGSAVAHLHDGQTLQHDGVNSNGGAFSFTTTGDVTFNQDVNAPNVSIDAYLNHTGDANTYLLFQPDHAMFYIGGKWLLDMNTVAAQDYVKIGDGSDVDINLNDDLTIDAATGGVTVVNLGLGIVHASAAGLLTSSAILNADIGNLGTAGTIAKFAATGLTDSIITEAGAIITVAATLALASGSITDTSGAISFGNENLTTTGTINVPMGDNSIYAINITNAVFSSTNSIYPININITKTAGNTQYTDDIKGIQNFIYHNYNDVIGNVYSYQSIFSLMQGDIGDATHPKSVSAFLGTLIQAAGTTIYGNMLGQQFSLDQNGGTITGDVIGSEIKIDADGTVNGTVYGLFLNLFSGVDWSIYSGSTYKSFFGGDVYIGRDTSGLFLGAAQDMEVSYGGVFGLIDTGIITASDLIIDCGALKTLELATPVFGDLQFSLSGAKVPAVNFPIWETFTTNTKEYSFAVDDYIDTEANEAPHSWKEGTNGRPHLHITTKAANSTGADRFAKFTVWVAYCDTNEVWQETPFTAELTIPDGTAALYMFFLDMGADLTLTNYILEAEIKLRVKRIAATGGTEYAGNIFITQAGVHLANNTMGSRQERVK